MMVIWSMSLFLSPRQLYYRYLWVCHSNSSRTKRLSQNGNGCDEDWWMIKHYYYCYYYYYYY